MGTNTRPNGVRLEVTAVLVRVLPELVASLNPLSAMQGGPIISCYRQGKGATEGESNFPKGSRCFSVIARVASGTCDLRNQRFVGNGARKRGRTGPRLHDGTSGQARSTATLPPHITPAGCQGDSFLKFQKLLQQTEKPLARTIPQVARPSRAGACLPGGFPLHNFHLKRSSGPWWPVLLRPINGFRSGMQSEGALPAGGGGGWRAGGEGWEIP